MAPPQGLLESSEEKYFWGEEALLIIPGAFAKRYTPVWSGSICVNFTRKTGPTACMISFLCIGLSMVQAMESGCGIYRTEEGMRHALETIRQLRERYANIRVNDTSKIFNTELLECIELGYGLDIAEASCLGALERRESRGAHQRLDEGMQKRDDVNYLKHSQVFYQGEAPAKLHWQDVDVRFSAPAERVYGDAGKGAKA